MNDVNEGYKYTGQREETSIGFYYYGARFYDPRIGRFITEDTYVGEITNAQSQNIYIYTMNNPMKYVDPTGHWNVTIQEFESGNRNIQVEYEDNIMGTVGAALNALPLGSAFDYDKIMNNFAGDIFSLLEDNLTDYYIYQPKEESFERFKELDVSVATINDSLDIIGGYSRLANNFTNSITQNLVKNAGTIVTAGLFLYDSNKRWDRTDRDQYIRAMIKEAGIDSYLNRIDSPEDLFINMIYIEEKLNSYEEENYKLYNRYFGGVFGLNDYSDNYGISIWDKLLGNVDIRKEEKEVNRKYFKDLARRLSTDFQEDALDI